MNLSKPLSWKSVVAMALVAAAVPVFAQKHRAVGHPTTAVIPAESIVATGTILDAVTGQAVYLANVRIGNRSDNTDKAGKFKVTTTIAGTGTMTVSRTGYVTVNQNVTPGSHDFTIHVQPTPTITLRTTAGATYAIDFESAEFGYVPPFGSYNKGDKDEFCKPDGTAVTLNRTEFARITGPATTESHAACCPTNPVQKINAQLKSGETTALYFVDSCLGYSIDFIGRDHVAGTFVYTKFSDVAEIIFP